MSDTDAVLQLVADNSDIMNAVNYATALHRLAVINKRRRAGRDALLRDRRFDLLMDSLVERAPDLSARSVSDVLWSSATLQHWPSTMLIPVLTAVSAELDKNTFEAHHLSTMVWALAKLSTKPVRLLERMEEQAVPRLEKMNMQNFGNLLWGCAALNYRPATLLPAIASTLLSKPETIATAKPVEVADLAASLRQFCSAGAHDDQHDDLLLALAGRAAPDEALESFSSRQLVALIGAFAELELAARLPEGLLGAWVGSIRSAHEGTPLLVRDARDLEASLIALEIDGSWIKRTEMLNNWIDAVQRSGKRTARDYSDEELRAAFEAIDTDKSGDIDMDELRSALMAIKRAADAKSVDVEGMLALADADGNGSIDFEEFKQLMLDDA